MPLRTIRRVLTPFALALVSAIIALAQSETSAKVPVADASYGWQVAQSAGSSTHKLFVVTLDKPNRRQTCHIQSFTSDKLVCSRVIGGPRTFLREQIVALILPGDDALRRRVLLELNGGLGAAIWGTVVLAAACPVCAAATGVAALFFFGFAGAISFTDDQPDRLLYLAPGQELSRKLGFIQS